MHFPDLSSRKNPSLHLHSGLQQASGHWYLVQRVEQFCEGHGYEHTSKYSLGPHFGLTYGPEVNRNKYLLLDPVG